MNEENRLRLLVAVLVTVGLLTGWVSIGPGIDRYLDDSAATAEPSYAERLRRAREEYAHLCAGGDVFLEVLLVHKGLLARPPHLETAIQPRLENGELRVAIEGDLPEEMWRRLGLDEWSGYESLDITGKELEELCTLKRVRLSRPNSFIVSTARQ